MTAAQADDEAERELVAAIHTRRRRMCIAEGAHHGHEAAAAEPGTCPRCGL
jgi:hypothetical protein